MEEFKVWLGVVGFILSIGVLIWDVYKWKDSRPRLDVTVVTDIRMYNPPQPDPNRYIRIIVRNRGQRKTTLTGLGIVAFHSADAEKADDTMRAENFAVAAFRDASLPAMVDGGEQWSGLFTESPAITALRASERMYCVLYHSMADKPCMAKLQFPTRI